MKWSRSVLLTLCPFLLIANVITATQSSPMSVGGVLANPLTGAPTVSVSTNCTSGSTTWEYSVTALDAAGGSTVGTTAQTTVGCPSSGVAGISATNYNKVTITAVKGSVSCNIYRVLPSLAAGLIANVPCGLGISTIYLDTSTSALNTTSAPTTDTTGSVNATGIVMAQAFNASAGTNAGTSAWVGASGQLSLCGSQPCVPPTTSFFVQAPNGIGTSFGWTWPTSPNSSSQAQLVYLAPAAADTGGKTASTVGYIGADTTTTHALFATSAQPAFRAIGTSDTSVNWMGTSSGTAQAQIVSMPQVVPTLSTGLEVDWKPAAANTGAGPTLQVDSNTAEPITKCGTAPLLANDLTTSAIAKVIYDGVEFQLQDPQAGACSAVATLCAGATSTVPVNGKLYFGFGTNGSSGNEPQVYLPIAVSGTVVALHATVSAAPPQTITLHARYKGGYFTSDLTCSVGTTATSCDVSGGTQAIAESTTSSPTNWDIEADAANSGTAGSRNYAICLKVVGAN